MNSDELISPYLSSSCFLRVRSHDELAICNVLCYLYTLLLIIAHCKIKIGI